MIEQSIPFLISSIHVQLLRMVMVTVVIDGSFGMQYMVGDSVWSIPAIPDFYTNWSSSLSFQIGDTLFFEFDTQLHNVMQVSRREYESCTANHPYRAFKVGPAIVPLIEQGVFYFICSVSNYCGLGQKVAVTVHQQASPSPNTNKSAPSPSSVLIPINSQSSTSSSHVPSGDGHDSGGSGTGSSSTANACSSLPAPVIVEWFVSVLVPSVGDACFNQVLNFWMASAALCLIICLCNELCL